MVKISLETLQKAGKLQQLQPILDIVNSKVFLAGGALRTIFDAKDTLVDFDLFFTDLTHIPQVKEKLAAAGYEEIFTCPLGSLFTFLKDSVKIQLVCEKSYKHPSDVLKEFDLTPCCFALDGEFLYSSLQAIRCVRKKRLMLNAVTFPVATFNRILKYYKKGYALFTAPRQFVELIAARSFDDLDMRNYID